MALADKWNREGESWIMIIRLIIKLVIDIIFFGAVFRNKK